MEKAKIPHIATTTLLSRSSQELECVITSLTIPGMKNFVENGPGDSVPQTCDFAVLLGLQVSSSFRTDP